MANIDTSKIENFDEMTLEEKVKALLEMDIPDEVDMSAWVPKKTFDAKASEAAKLSRELKSKMTDDERDAAEKEAARLAEAEKYSALEVKYNELLQEKKMAEYKAKYLALGFSERLAADTAAAMVAGDTERVFENTQKHQTEYAKKVRAELMDGTPKPDGSGAGEKVVTKEDIFAIKDPVERQDAIAANISLFHG